MRSTVLSVKCNRCATLPILLLALLLTANAERDFNANDSQVSETKGAVTAAATVAATVACNQQ